MVHVSVLQRQLSTNIFCRTFTWVNKPPPGIIYQCCFGPNWSVGGADSHQAGQSATSVAQRYLSREREKKKRPLFCWRPVAEAPNLYSLYWREAAAAGFRVCAPALSPGADITVISFFFFFPPARTATSNSIRSTRSGTRGPSWTGTQLRVGMAVACDIDWFLLFPLRQRGEPNQLCHNETKFIFISLKPRAEALDWNPRCWVLIQL